MQTRWMFIIGLALLFTSVAIVLNQQRASFDGLKVEDVVVGTGAEAQADSKVAVHYTGWFRDGTRFDSSYARGHALEFVLGRGEVIAGWEKGLSGMRVGGKRRLTIPPKLGYPEGAGIIPANSTLNYEIELLSVEFQGNTQPRPE